MLGSAAAEANRWPLKMGGRASGRKWGLFIAGSLWTLSPVPWRLEGALSHCWRLEGWGLPLSLGFLFIQVHTRGGPLALAGKGGSDFPWAFVEVVGPGVTPGMAWHQSVSLCSLYKLSSAWERWLPLSSISDSKWRHKKNTWIPIPPLIVRFCSLYLIL